MKRAAINSKVSTMAKRFVSPAALFLHDAGKFLYGDLEGDLAPFAADLGTKADWLDRADHLTDLPDGLPPKLKAGDLVLVEGANPDGVYRAGAPIAAAALSKAATAAPVRRHK